MNEAEIIGSVVQYPLGRIIQVVELPVTNSGDKQPREDGAEADGDRQQEDHGAHASSARMRCSTRDAFQITMPLESGMRMAATSGLTRPAAAAATATTL